MKQIFFFIFLFTVVSKTFSQQKLGCPVKKNKYVEKPTDPNDFGDPSKAFVVDCNSCKIYSCSSGEVKAVDTIDGFINIYIISDSNFISYHFLKSANVSSGQIIKKGQKIGRSRSGSVAVMISNKEGRLIDAKEMFDCK